MKREYPDAPIVGVGAIICNDARILLIRRGREPSRAAGASPAAASSVGETVHDAVCREALEETGLRGRGR